MKPLTKSSYCVPGAYTLSWNLRAALFSSRICCIYHSAYCPFSVYAGTDLDKAFKTIYENKWYWPSIDSDKAPEEPDLYVNVDGTVGGSVTMQYTSDSKLPVGTTGGQSHGSVDGKNVGKSASGKETK